MRFNLSVAAVLVLSLAAFAQHSSGGSSSSGSSSSGGSSHASSGGGGGGGSSHSSSSGGGSHGASSSHASSGGSSSGSHASSASAHSSSPAAAGAHSTAAPSHPLVDASHTGPANTEHADNQLPVREPVGHPVAAKEIQPSATNTVPENRTFFSFLRHPFRKADPDLRHAICKVGPCKKQPPPPVETASELRPPICRGKACQCPPGEAPGPRGGCVAVPTNPITCAAGQYWNAGACVPASTQCPPNQRWNGATCVTRMDDCASINSRAAMLGNEIRGAKSQMEDACRNDSSGSECNELRGSYDGAVDRYRMLQNEAPINCRNMLVDPLAF